MSQVNAGAPGTPTAVGAPPNGKRPIGVIFSSIIEGARTLVRQQLELAKIEAGEAVAERAKGAGMMGAAGVIALYAIGFIAAAASAGLAIVLPMWLSLLIVGLVFALITGVLALVGRHAIKTAPKPELTQETLKEDARWAKRQLAR